MSEARRFVVPASAAGQRLDRWLADQQSELSRSQIKRLLGEAGILLNGTPPPKPGVALAAGDVIALQRPHPPPHTPQPEAIPLSILYEDDDVIVLDKAAGLVVHPAPGHAGATLVNALLARAAIDDEAQRDRPGIVHRLDRDTSGVLIAAKSSAARQALQTQFRNRATTKRYLALTHGTPETATGTIQGPIGRHPTQRQKRAVVADGRPATTHFETVQRYQEEATLLRLTPVSGRTHQIRVHLAAIGLPVVGDALYGPRRSPLPPLNRHFLHAESLTIRLPSGEERTFAAPLPIELRRYLDGFRRVDDP